MITGWIVSITILLPVGGSFAFVPIMLIISAVYQLIIVFINWYMNSEISSLGFVKTILMFMLGMILYVAGMMIVMVFGWEVISVLSFLLISYWMRSEAVSSSFAAVLYNRFSDFGIMLISVTMESWVLSMLAIMGNSALWLFSYWLPIAMESPTPVSSLLHSSTMVVASVILAITLGGSIVIGIVGVVMIAMMLPSWFDSNKMIALSTSVHLCVMFISVSVGIYSLCIMHILTHAFINASCFVASSVIIGISSVQDIRLWSISISTIVMVLSFLILAGVGGGLIYHSKEMVILQILIMVVIWTGWSYTNQFISAIGSMNSNMLNMSWSLVLLFVLGSSSIPGIEVVSVLLVMGMINPLFITWSGYVTNN